MKFDVMLNIYSWNHDDETSVIVIPQIRFTFETKPECH